MNKRQTEALRQVIDKWIGDEAEKYSDEWPVVWWPENIAAIMTKAASAVFDANASGQRMAEGQKE
jgi:hypothetical protein